LVQLFTLPNFRYNSLLLPVFALEFVTNNIPIEKRINELKKIGFKHIIIPEASLDKIEFNPETTIDGIKNINEFIKIIFNKNLKKNRIFN